MNKQEIIKLAVQVKAAKKKIRDSRAKTFKPYAWQKDLYAAGPANHQRMLLAANRVGKTLGAAFEVYCHLTGDYPSWWNGVRFKFAPLIWACGVSGEQIRDVLQRELVGDVRDDKSVTGGMVPPDKIVDYIRAPVTPKLLKDVHIRHISGDVSTLSFKSYTQGPGPLMGSSVDFALVDEQPPDDAYGQILTRTMTGNKGQGGYMLVTCTPELGMTRVLKQWMSNKSSGQYLRNVTWDDAEHLTPEIKAQMLNAIPKHERELRSKGLPIFGSGLIYDFDPEMYTCEPFEIPGYYRVCAAIDFGFAHPFAAIWCAMNLDTDQIYVYDEYREENALPSTHALAINRRGANIPVIYPPDGESTEKGSGESLITTYHQCHVNAIAVFKNPDQSNFVNPGIVDIKQRIPTGRFKIFSNCTKTLEEMGTYHRKDGKIVKLFDDLMDAMRYCTMSIGTYGCYKYEANIVHAQSEIQYEELDV